jgi:thiol-disulfide isomerase/thioredoxin
VGFTIDTLDWSGYIPLILIALLLLMQIVMRLRARRAIGRQVVADERLPAEWLARPYLVAYFASSHCPPCRQLSPLVERLAAEGLPILKYDLHDCGDLARQLGAAAPPAFVYIVSGRVAAVRLGAMSEASLRQWLTPQE